MTTIITLIALAVLTIFCLIVYIGDQKELIQSERDVFILTLVDNGLIDKLTPAQVDRWIKLRNIPQVIARGIDHAPINTNRTPRFESLGDIPDPITEQYLATGKLPG